MARAIAEGDGFALGAPSRSADDAEIILPVLRTRPRPRAYALVDEVADQISAVDPGQVDRLRVKNESSHLVFLAPGTLFEGRETASRGTMAGILLEPESTVDVDVRCVHASCSVHAGAVLRLATPLAPNRVRRALLSRDQGLVWSAVRAVLSPRSDASDSSDDLVAALADPGPSEREVDSTARARRPDTDQCGVIVIDAYGVSCLEIFDHPESWRAFAGRWTDRYPGQRGQGGVAPNLVTIAPEKARHAAMEFLLHLGQVEQRQVSAHAWSTIDSSCQYTCLGDEVVHLLVFGGGDPWTQEAVASRTAAGRGGMLGAVPGSDLFASPAAGEGDVAVAQVPAVEAEEELATEMRSDRPRHRKVLTSGWDDPTFDSLERFSRKEFGGDRSAAMRSLIRQGLRRRGYMGPTPPRPAVAHPSVPTSDEGSAHLEARRTAMEMRVLDYERIARTDTYAQWLRERARLELEHMAESSTEDVLRDAAQSAIQRLPVASALPEAEETPLEDITIEEAVPAAPPVDIRPLLRRAFSASAAGQYSDALHLLDEVLDTEPDNRTALLGRAVALRRSGKTQEALAALEVVLRLEPANAAALLNRGRVLQEMGDLPGALETFERLASVAPNDWDVWVARGDVLSRMGRIHDALASYAEAFRRNPDDDSLNAKIRALERSRPPPPPSPAARAALPREIQEGQSYLVKEARPDLSYRMLRSLVVRSVPALVVARGSPAQVRAEHALQGVSVLQLTHEPGEERVPPTALPLLTNAIERFVIENHGRAAILLDGLSLLVETNGFRDTALFIARVNESILPSHATFFVSMAPGALEEKEEAILERDLRVLS